MKTRTSFLKRCMACMLALLMVVSVLNNGIVIPAGAVEENAASIDAGTLVANNYQLTDEEKAFLSSGLLIGDSYGYTVPTDAEALVSVDTDNGVITAKAYDNWVPTQAYIVVAGEVAQTVSLTNGKGNYDTSVGNAFAVKVDYVLTVSVDEATQTKLLGAAAWMNSGIANGDAISAQSGNLYILEKALPELAKLVSTGIQTSFGGTISFTDELKTAVYTLNEQMEPNGGKLNLSAMIEKYEAGSKTEYLMTKGAAMRAEAASFAANISTINVTLQTMVDNLAVFIQNGWVDKTTASQLETVTGVAANLEQALTPVAADGWDVLTAGVLKDGLTKSDYTKLDSLVQAMKGVSTPAPAVKNPLTVAKTTLQKNMSMFDVTVKVALQVVENKADSDKLITFGEKSVVITLAEKASAEEILAAIEASGVIAAAKTAWGETFVEAQYTAEVSQLPESLTQDITYSVTYSPVKYTVNCEYADVLTVPYGYQLTLPVHEDITKAYDYDINGERYAQGDVYTVVGDAQISRSTGKAYTATDLYTVIAANYGNDVAKAILTSGALLGNEVIAYREPDPADAEGLLKLFDDVLTAKNYDAKYQGLSWVPYTYGTDGTENTFAGSTADWTTKSVKVQYMLTLSNFSQAQVEEILALAATLKTEAQEQTATLDRFAAYHSTMGQLDKTKLGALNGVIDVTDFTPEDGTSDDEANLAMRAYFKGLVGGIIANNLDTNNQLKIYNILGKYKSEGLRYYYANNAMIQAEIDSLAGYLSDMLADEEKVNALKIMVSEAGFPEYADKIADLEAIVSQVRASLSAPNAAIDLSSPNLGKLMDVLTGTGKVEIGKVGSPYLMSKLLTAMDNSQVMVQVIIEAGSNSATVTTDTMDRGTVLTPEIIAALKEKVEAKASQLLGGNQAYYELTVEGKSIDELVGVALKDAVNIYYTYTAKQYTVKIDGEDDQIITVDNLEIQLPKHSTTGWSYRYSIDGEENITRSTYTFTTAQLDTLFADGSYTVSRTEVNEAEEKLEATFGDWLVKDNTGKVVGITANVDGDKDGIMGFAMTLMNSGYSYIGLNGEPLLYMNADNSLEISLQTLINAILNDNDFGSQTLINLGKNGKGRLVAATMQLGSSAEDIHYTDLDFVLNMTSVPAQMSSMATGLEKIEKYISFQSMDGTLAITLNLPEDIYAAYLTALVPTGYVDKNDMNAVNSEIALQFLFDYINVIVSTDANAETFENTLKLINYPYDLDGYDAYYQMIKNLLTSDGVQINPVENGEFEIALQAKGQEGIDALIGMLGVDVSAYSTYLGMIKEYKYADAELAIGMITGIRNTAATYEALVLDLDNLPVPQYTEDLTANAAAMNSNCAIMLLDDVDGDLVFNGTTILDLNGYTVNGSITANGKLYIVDSSLISAKLGQVTGSVSGKAVIMGGKYTADVTAFLKEGYQQTNGVVRNTLYTLESDGTNVTVILNADVMKDGAPNTKDLALEIATDLVLNNLASTSLTANGNAVYSFQVNDLLGILNSSAKGDALLLEAMDFVDAEGITALTNLLLNDLLDFAAVKTAVASNEAVAEYTLTTAPWMVAIAHDTAENVLVFGITSNEAKAKTGTLSIKIADPSGTVQELMGALDQILDVDAQVDLKQPVYNAESNTVTVSGSATANMALDLTVDRNYLTVLTVILANGKPANQADLIAALNSGDEDALKDAFDELTVREVLNAFKSVTDFATMAAKLGITVDTAEAADLESALHVLLTASRKTLEALKVVGPNTKLGSFDTDDDGVYECSGDTAKTGKISRYGYTVSADVSVELNLTATLFTDCLWGDANHDGVVDSMDATLVLRYYAGLEDNLCLKRTDVNQDGEINSMDATLILRYYAGLIAELPYKD